MRKRFLIAACAAATMTFGFATPSFAADQQPFELGAPNCQGALIGGNSSGASGNPAEFSREAGLTVQQILKYAHRCRSL